MTRCTSCKKEFEDFLIRPDGLCSACHLDKSLTKTVREVERRSTNPTSPKKSEPKRASYSTKSNIEEPRTSGVAATNAQIPDRKSQTEKQCPFCAENIKAEAIVCRFCGRDLDAERVKETRGSTQTNVTVADGVRMGAGLTVFLVIAVVVLLVLGIIF